MFPNVSLMGPFGVIMCMDELLGQQGRIRQQLDQYGDLITIVVGKFNELSEGGHQLLKAVAESRVAKTATRAGEAVLSRAMEKGVIVGMWMMPGQHWAAVES